MLVLVVLGRRALGVLIGCLGRGRERVLWAWACVGRAGSLARPSRAGRGLRLESVACADEIPSTVGWRSVGMGRLHLQI